MINDVATGNKMLVSLCEHNAADKTQNKKNTPYHALNFVIKMFFFNSAYTHTTPIMQYITALWITVGNNVSCAVNIKNTYKQSSKNGKGEKYVFSILNTSLFISNCHNICFPLFPYYRGSKSL